VKNERRQIIVKTKRVNEFVKGQDLFTSTGISRVKVTKDDKVECLEIPITSTGVAELIDALQEKAPQPPMSNKLVNPDDDMGREMGLSKKTWVKVLDTSDPTYIKQKEDHETNLGLAIVLKGINVEIKNEKGVVVENDQEKIEILKGMGLSGDQFSQIVEDIQALTKWSEEEQTHFFD